MKCQYNQWPRDWQNIFAITRFHNIDVLFHIIISLLLGQIQSLIILRSIMINQGSTVLKEQSCTYIVFETKTLRLRQSRQISKSACTDWWGWLQIHESINRRACFASLYVIIITNLKGLRSNWESKLFNPINCASN